MQNGMDRLGLNCLSTTYTGLVEIMLKITQPYRKSPAKPRFGVIITGEGDNHGEMD